MKLGRLKQFFKSKAVRYTYFGVLLAVAGFYVAARRSSLGAALSQADVILIILSWLACLGVTLVYFYIVQQIFSGLGALISFKKALKIIGLAQLGKYLPFKVMYPANFYLFSKEEGIGSDKIALCFLISNAMSFLAGILCAAPVFFILTPSIRLLLVGLIVFLIIMVHPAILSFLFRRFSSWMPVAGETGAVSLDNTKLGYAFSARILAIFLFNWGLAGVSLFFGLRALYPIGFADFPFCLSAVALGSVVGLLAFFAPAGIGVREAVGTVILSRIVPLETAVLAMLVIRVGYILSDIACGLAGMIVKRRIEP